MSARSVFALIIILFGVHEAQARQLDPLDVATLRLLDKATARVEEREVEVGKAFLFGPLHILVQACRQTSPEERPEAAAFLEINEFKPGQPEQTVFRGWMFASNPALSALEHPVYDVWLTFCKKPAKIEVSTKPAATAPVSPAAAVEAAPAKPAEESEPEEVEETEESETPEATELE